MGVTLENFETQFRTEVLPHLKQDGYTVTRREKAEYFNTDPSVVYTISW